ncbi:MAG: hypothetical protein NVSMB2_01290 [Chloroflexota bacterium]
MDSNLIFRELGNNPVDLRWLRHFYDDLYCREFPEADERESLDNMVAYLRAAGTDANGYHILLALESSKVVGGSIADYFAPSHAGVIEFVVVAPGSRGRGWGTALVRQTENLLVVDAERARQKLQYVMAELNDPWLSVATRDVLDPFERARWWDRRGYGRLAFPYVQPPLSSDQASVDHLMLCTRPVARPAETALPADAVLAFVRDYLMYAMRFTDPNVSPDFVRMRDWLSQRSFVSIESLRTYADHHHGRV